MIDNDPKANKTLQKIDQLIDDIEKDIYAMTMGVEIDKLTPAKRYDLTVKFRNQYIKLLPLRGQIEAKDTDNSEDSEYKAMLEQWIRMMRGEVDVSEITDGPEHPSNDVC
jgi:hypothetical protein